MAVEKIDLPSLSSEQTTPVSTVPAVQGKGSRNEENRGRRRVPAPETDSAEPNVQDEDEDRPQHRIDRLA
jgi:hypothetical protein